MKDKKYAYYLIDGEKVDLGINKEHEKPSKKVLDMLMPKLVNGKNVELVTNITKYEGVNETINADFLWKEMMIHLDIKNCEDINFLRDLASGHVVFNEAYKNMMVYLAIGKLSLLAEKYIKIKTLLK